MSTENTKQQNIVDLTSPLTIYNAPEAVIAELKSTYLNLKIAGIEDKDGYEAARKGLRTLVGLRNKVDKHRLDLKRQIDAGAKILLGELAPIEANLKTEVDRINNELERIRLEKQEADRLRFLSHTEYLFKLGFMFDGTLYKLGKYAFAPSTLQEMDDNSFAALMFDVEPYAESLAKAKAAEDARLKAVEEENERLRKELEAKNAPAKGIEVVEMKGNIGIATPQRNITVSLSDTANVSDESTPEANTVPKKVTGLEGVYMEGFENCRKQIINRLNDPTQITRRDLLVFISNLKPQEECI